MRLFGVVRVLSLERPAHTSLDSLALRTQQLVSIHYSVDSYSTYSTVLQKSLNNDRLGPRDTDFLRCVTWVRSHVGISARREREREDAKAANV